MIFVESIRPHDLGFPNEASRYLQKLSTAELPPELEHLRHTIPWPVDMSDPLAYITCYFGDKNYSDPAHEKPHNGIDIQLPKGTKIVSPEPTTLVNVELGWTESNERRQLTNVLLHGDSGLAYKLAHLDTRSLPAHLTQPVLYNYDERSGIRFSERDVIGQVGIFFGREMRKHGLKGLGPEVKVPDNVGRVYKRSYNHIHITIQHPQLRRHDYYTGKGRSVDPLPLLEKLY